jgi:2-keto-4-pentenoate hydratase/2-oxohepta-3-ene-1,7-dioic acid hydratase in catechol pathway
MYLARLLFITALLLTGGILLASSKIDQFFRYQSEHHQQVHLGVKRGAKSFDLGPCDSLDSFLSLVKRGKSGSSRAIKLDSEKLLVPIPQPLQKTAVALNYQDHQDETHLKELLLFPKLSPLTSWNTPVVYRGSKEQLLDYEVEWGFMLAQDIDRSTLKKITEKNITDYVAGVFLILDMTSREVQVRDATLSDPYLGFARAKGFESYAPVGQFFITYADFLLIKDKFKMTLAVNGEVKQSSGLSLMVKGPLAIIQLALSKKMQQREYKLAGKEVVQAVKSKLSKGDVVLTGTPAGMTFIAPTIGTKISGFIWGLVRGKPILGTKEYIIRHQPPHLKPGDTILASAPWLGEIDVKIVNSAK